MSKKPSQSHGNIYVDLEIAPKGYLPSNPYSRDFYVSFNFGGACTSKTQKWCENKISNLLDHNFEKAVLFEILAFEGYIGIEIPRHVEIGWNWTSRIREAAGAIWDVHMSPFHPFSLPGTSESKLQPFSKSIHKPNICPILGQSTTSMMFGISPPAPQPSLAEKWTFLMGRASRPRGVLSPTFGPSF